MSNNPATANPGATKPKRERKVVNIGVRVTPEQKALLDKLEAQTGISVSDHLRSAVNVYLGNFGIIGDGGAPVAFRTTFPQPPAPPPDPGTLHDLPEAEPDDGEQG
jgi:hypothetical protein